MPEMKRSSVGFVDHVLLIMPLKGACVQKNPHASCTDSGACSTMPDLIHRCKARIEYVHPTRSRALSLQAGAGLAGVVTAL